MKIVQINAVNRYSSTGLTTWQMHKEFLSRGFESFVFCANENNPEDNVFQIGNKYDHRLHSFLSHLLGSQGCHSVRATKQLVKRLREIKPDVVMLRNLHSNYINLEILLNYLAKENIPTTITLHDCWTFTGHCCYFIDSQCNRWKYGCGKCPDLRNWNKSWIFDNSRRNLTLKDRLFSSIPRLAVIGVSKWVTSFIKESILSNACIVESIYNWIDMDLFKPTENTLRQDLDIHDKFTILGIAQTWNEPKGLYDFIEVAKRMPDSIFVMVGKMPASISLPENIKAVGATSSPGKLAEYYTMADVFFMPSMRETFGKVTAEALACGTPVVAYNTTATPELIGDSCGAVIRPKDLEAAVAELSRIRLKGKDFYTKSCRTFASEWFSMDNNINQYINIFQSLRNA